MKTYVITVSKNFLKGHPKEGQPTRFREKILNGEKIHTLRGNYKYWSNIIDQVNKGKAVLSVREWTGKPYNSKQQEIKQFTKLGKEKIFRDKFGLFHMPQNKEGKKVVLNFFHSPFNIAENDGLSVEDFHNWFETEAKKKKDKGDQELIIIHFTNLRYE